MADTDAFHPIPAGSCEENQGCRRTLSDESSLIYLGDGAWARYPGVDFGMGASWFQARVATPMSGYIEVRLKDPGASGKEGGKDTGGEILAGICRVPTTGGWDEWIHVNCPIQPVAGVKDVRLVFRLADDQALFNVHSFSFAASSAGLYRETASKFRAAEADSMSANITIEDSGDADGGKSIGAIRNGDGIAFARVSLSENTNYFEARIATPAHGAVIDIHVIDLESDRTTLVGSLHLPSTGAWDVWRTIGCEIDPISGRKILELVFRNDYEDRLFRLNWFRFAAIRRTGPDRVFNARNRIHAKDYTVSHTIQQEPSMEEGYNLAYIRDGSFVVFDAVDFGDTGLEYAAARVASAGTGGIIEFYIDGECLGTMQVDRSTSWQDWSTAIVRLAVPVTGTHKVRLRFSGGDGFLFNLLWFSFSDKPFEPDRIRLTIDGRTADLNLDFAGPAGQTPVLADLAGLGEALGLEVVEQTAGLCRLRKGDLTASFAAGAGEVPCAYADGSPSRPLRLETPPRCEGGSLRAGVRDLALWAGYLCQWCAYTGTIALKKSLSDRPRQRLRTDQGRLSGEGDSLLRGLSIRFDAENHAYPFAVLDRLKGEGLNALYALVEMSAISSGNYNLVAELDELVAYTAAEGLYLVLGPTPGPELSGDLDEAYVQSFWETCAPRYRHAAHVAYEICREAWRGKPPMGDRVRQLQQRLYAYLRAEAPDSLILVGSWACAGASSDLAADLAALGLGREDWKNTAVAFNSRTRDYDLVRQQLAVLKDAGRACLCVGLAPDVYRDNRTMAPPGPDLDLIALCESTGTGWLAEMQAGSLSTPGAFRTRLEESGIRWTAQNRRRES